MRALLLSLDDFFVFTQWDHFYTLQISVDILHINVVSIRNWEERKRERNDTSQHPEDKQQRTWVTPLDRDLSARQRVKFTIDFPKERLLTLHHFLKYMTPSMAGADNKRARQVNAAGLEHFGVQTPSHHWSRFIHTILNYNNQVELQVFHSSNVVLTVEL